MKVIWLVQQSFSMMSLKTRQGQHFSDLIQQVPNLNYAGGTSRPRYFQIRGEGSVSRYADQGPPSTYVGLVLDGMDSIRARYDYTSF
jgi:hypothetical protein